MLEIHESITYRAYRTGTIVHSGELTTNID